MSLDGRESGTGDERESGGRAERHLHDDYTECSSCQGVGRRGVGALKWGGRGKGTVVERRMQDTKCKGP